MHLTWVDFLVMVLYMGGLSLIGLHFSRQQVSREEYLLGSRNIHWLLAAGSVVATLVSTLTFLAVPGEIVRYGLAYFTGVLALPLAIPVVTRILLPKLMGLHITSMYEYLERRYDAQVRIAAALVFTVRTLIWMGLIIYSCSFAVAQMAGWNIYWTILVTGLITTFYASAGGMRTVIWTDNLQLLILVGGALAVPVAVMLRTDSGPADWWVLFSQAGKTQIQVFSLDLTVRLTVVGAMLSQFFWSICTNGSDQVAVQRYLATPSLSAARRTAWVYLAMNVGLLCVLGVCGLALFAFYLQQSGLSAAAFQQQIAPNADKLMPQFIVSELPQGVSGLVLAALLAAAMSSLSSGINSAAAVVMSDLVDRTGSRRPEARSLAMTKAVSVGAGLVGVVSALGITWSIQQTDWNLVDVTQRLNHIFVGPLAVLFFAGMLFRRTSKFSALAGFTLGVLCSIYVAFGRGQSISFTWLVPGSFMAGFLLAALLNRLLPAPAKETGAETVLK